MYDDKTDLIENSYERTEHNFTRNRDSKQPFSSIKISELSELTQQRHSLNKNSNSSSIGAKLSSINPTDSIFKNQRDNKTDRVLTEFI